MKSSIFEPVNILLVDDQPGKLLTYEVILKDLNENLIKANSAREAFTVLLQQDIAVLLVDVSMPELDGFQFVAMLREHPRFSNTAVIFISAIHLSELDLVKGYQTGAVDYVSVPVVPEILRAKVRIFTDLHRKTRELETLNQRLETRVLERTQEVEKSAGRLRDSERRFRLASDAAEFGAYDHDVATGQIYCSPRLKTLLKIEQAGDISLEQYLTHIYEADRDAVRSCMSPSAEQDELHEIEFRTYADDGGACWRLNRGSVVTRSSEETDNGLHVMGIVLDITERKAAADRQELLMLELDHRVKNILASISAITRLSGRAATSIGDFVRSLDARILSMADAHNLLRRNNWEGADLHELLNEVLAAHRSAVGDSLIIEGEQLRVQPKACQALALIFHELATNALKYGAWSQPGGKVTISWRRAGGYGPRALNLSWQESGGPVVTSPASKGFGSTVIATAASELDAEIEYRFNPDGVRCTFEWMVEQPFDTGARPNASTAIPMALKTPASGRRILIVEDEPFVAMQLKMQLEDAGYVVIGPASNLAEGIDMARRETFDAALIDVSLGRDLSAPIADELMSKGVPFAFSTGYSDNSNLPVRLHDIPRLMKPYTEPEVYELVNRLTEAKKA